MLIDDAKTALDALVVSPTFAMSLGAKELFHTNFLAFLLETRDEGLETLRVALREVLGLPFQSGGSEMSTCVVWRERNYLDLVVIPIERSIDGKNFLSKKRALVIEAKLKSMPTKRQLHEYLEKTISLPCPEEIEGRTQRLSLKERGGERPVLRLLTPSGIAIHRDWPGVAWLDVANAIEDNISNATPFLQPILKDYAVSLKMILSVVAKVRNRVDAAWQKNQCPQYLFLYNELNDIKFRKMRIHDLTGKVGFDKLLSHIAAGLQKKLGYNDELFAKAIKSYVFFSRSQPGFTLEVPAEDEANYQLGVQVQGTKLRHFVSCKKDDPELERRILEKDFLSRWFNVYIGGKKLLGRNGEEVRQVDFSKKGRLTNLLVFNPKRFLYSEISLSAEFSVQDLAAHIEGSIIIALELMPSLA
jgi:hypothetical protein